MSEYQYYEFQKVDGRLSERDQLELRRYSSRARITATSFTNEYDWGDFKGDTDLWMERYFDGHLYLANWGTRMVQLAIPAGLLLLETAKRYCSTPTADSRQQARKLILTFHSEDDSDEDWVEGAGQLSPLLQLRQELASGDLRSLYLGWLLGVQAKEIKASEKEPPVPSGLETLSGPQQNLADFLRLDADLLAVAAQNSPRAPVEDDHTQEMSDWIVSLPTSEKDGLLRRLVTDEGAKLGRELRARFQRQRSSGQSTASPEPRTVAGLQAAADARRDHRQQEETRSAAMEKARQEAATSRVRAQFLDSLRGRSDSIWADVEAFAATRLPRNYDQIAHHMGDLRDLAKLEGNLGDFDRRLALFRGRHATKKALLGRIDRHIQN